MAADRHHEARMANGVLFEKGGSGGMKTCPLDRRHHAQLPRKFSEKRYSGIGEQEDELIRLSALTHNLQSVRRRSVRRVDS